MKPAHFTIGLLACLVAAAAADRIERQAPPYLRDALKDQRLEDVRIDEALDLKATKNIVALPGKSMGEGHPFHCVGKAVIWPFILTGDLENPKKVSSVLVWRKKKTRVIIGELKGSLRIDEPDQDFDRAGTLTNASSTGDIKSWDILLDPSWRKKKTGEEYLALMEFVMQNDKIKSNALCYNGAPSERYPGISEEAAKLRIMDEADDFPEFQYWRKQTLRGENLPPLDRIFREEDLLTPQEMSLARATPLFRGSGSPPASKFAEGFKLSSGVDSEPSGKNPCSVADLIETPYCSSTGSSGRFWISFSRDYAMAESYGDYIYEIHKPGGIDLADIFKRRHIPYMGANDRVQVLQEVVFSRRIEPRYIRGAHVMKKDAPDFGRFIPNPNFAP